MEGQVLFSENQRFRQWWIWTLIIAMNAMVLAPILLNKPENLPPDAYVLILTSLLLPYLLFFIIKMTTEIRTDGIYVRFFPFHLSYRHYGADKTAKAYIRTYSPMGEYGGWGIRYGINKGWLYNVSGNMGLQLELLDGKKVLIGTRKPDEIIAALRKSGMAQCVAESAVK